MMSHEKVIVISIRPEHAKNILNGKKTLELRKSVPKGFVGWVYVYVTKGVGKSKYHHLYNLTEYNNGKTLFSIIHHNKYSLVPDGFLNGKVVFRFWFDEYVKYVDCSDCSNNENGYECENDFRYLLSVDPVLRKETCLTSDEIEDYGNGKDLYAWHINKLEVFDKPMQLSDFQKEEYAVMPNGIFPAYQPISRPPQSWQYAYILGAKQ